MTDFIEQLNTNQFKDVQNFFNTMPRLKHTIKVKNPKTKKESEITLSGLNDFFQDFLSHDSLENYYHTNFSLMQHHNYSLSDIENLLF